VDTLTAARAQMELSLAFHMVFAALGMGLPVLMIVAEGLHLRTGKPHYRDLAYKWSRATALLFAVGAVSGTALAFELGLLWPRFMEFAGGVIGPAFALEGYAFFIEAIFLGLYLYGWDRLSPRAHWLCGFPVAISGLASGALVLAANAWMQSPRGFSIEGGRPVDVDPMAAFFTPSWLPMTVHSTLSIAIATGFAVAGVYAAGILRGRDDAYHRSALRIALSMGAAAALLMPLSGDWAAKNVARNQPVKLAAFEGHYKTQARAPIRVGPIEIPGALSFMAKGDADAVVMGLDDVPEDRRPNVWLTRAAFLVMVGCGMALAVLSVWFLIAAWRGTESRRLLRAVAWAAPLGFVALEAGWVVTEAGRQPWTIYGVMLTRDAVTSSPHVPATFFAFAVLYLGLAAAVVFLLRRLATGTAMTVTRHVD
jgi:cytochrome d ubiquinol oxidase subunit I